MLLDIDYDLEHEGQTTTSVHPSIHPYSLPPRQQHVLSFDLSSSFSILDNGAVFCHSVIETATIPLLTLRTVPVLGSLILHAKPISKGSFNNRFNQQKKLYRSIHEDSRT